MSVKAKKHLGQHFLKDEQIAKNIADSLTCKGYNHVLEIGPGMGVLSKYLFEKDLKVSLIELDEESVTYLKSHFINQKFEVYHKDFLKFDLQEIIQQEPLAIIGNFPYNISSQILFKTLEYKEWIPEFSGMFQKEVAERACATHGNKTYGILSVLVQAFYNTEYLFTVSEHVFDPPPKVKSGVMRMIRKKNYTLPCDEKLFFRVVKTSFQQRRKTLRNSLKSFDLSQILRADEIFSKRPEQLSVEDFIELTQKIASDLS